MDCTVQQAGFALPLAELAVTEGKRQRAGAGSQLWPSSSLQALFSSARGWNLNYSLSSADPAAPKPRGRGCAENGTSDCERKYQLCLGRGRGGKRLPPLAPARPMCGRWHSPILLPSARRCGHASSAERRQLGWGKEESEETQCSHPD